MMKEFKNFIMRGNVLDLAVAVVIGAAFGKIVSTIVDNIIMPVIGLLTAGVDFEDMKIILQEASLDASGEILEAEVAIGYGMFINSIIQFLIIAIVIFFVVHYLKKVQEKMDKTEKEEAKPEAPAEDILLLTEIRDLLKSNK